MKIDLNKFILKKYIKGGKVTDSVISAYIALHGVDGKGGRIANCNIPLDYRYRTLDNSPAREEHKEIYDVLEQYVKSFAKQFNEEGSLDTKGQIKSLYLWSEECGTGKTLTASCLLNEFIGINYLGSLKRGLNPPEIPVQFIDVNELQELYNKFNRSHIPKEIAEKASREYYNRLDNAKEALLVVFDDIGVRNATEAFRGDLHSLINYRVTNQLPSIYTANFPISELATIYDARLYDRIRDLTQTINMKSEGKRGIR